MAQQYVTGPVHTFLKFQGSNVEYLGTAERFPRVRWRRNYRDAMNDIGGQGLPFDRIFDGCDALVFLDLNRWNQSTVDRLETVPLAQNGTFGRTDPGDIGTLMIAEGYAFELSMLFPYSPLAVGGKVFMASMPLGLRFPAAMLEEDEWEALGTTNRKCNLSFYCGRVYDSTTGRFTLCDRTPNTTAIN